MQDKLQIVNDKALTILKQQPEQVISQLAPRTVTDIFISLNPSIIKLTQQDGGHDFMRRALSLMVIDLVEFFSTSNSMGATQVAQTVDLIIEKYGQYKLDDWALCFKKIKLGEYGKNYNRMDGNVIFICFDQYINEREAEFERQQAHRKQERERRLNQVQYMTDKEREQAVVDDAKNKPVPMPDSIKELKAKIGKDKPANAILPVPATDKMISKYMADFAALNKQQILSKILKITPVAFVLVDKVMMDMTTYLKYRIEHG